MRIFSLAQDLTLDTNKFYRTYLGVTNPEAAQVDRIYLDVGEEVRLISDNLKDQHAELHPELDEAAKKVLNPADLGLQLASEDTLLAWPFFPARLGRISSRMVGDSLYFHQEAEVLPAQLQALRASKPDKQHFRFAVVNGFGTNLGDCTIGITAFRVVLQCMKRHLPSISCDILFGPGTSAATEDILGYEKEVDRVLFQAPTVAEFAQYDGYFDFSGLISMPKYDVMPAADWVMWWCGLDPQTVPAAQKRNRGYIRWDAWNAVQALLRDKPGKKIFFNPKASIPLRTMPAEVAVKFARRLLELDPEIKLVIDQPIEFKHKRVIDLGQHIDSPEKFKALVGQMDGVITVNSFASHVADMCSIPTVHLCASVPGSIYPYYPFTTPLNPEGYEDLPAFGKVKVAEEAWGQMRGAYQTAWESVAPAKVMALLREKMAQRQAATGEPRGLVLVGERKPASCVVPAGNSKVLKHQRLAPEHVKASERFSHLTQHLLKPGAVCLMACAPDPELAVTLAKRVAPYGELIIMEPRALMARSLESSLYLAGAFASRVLQTMGLAGVTETRMTALDPWSESCSTEWGNTHQAISVPNQTVDALALERCSCLLIQSPMAYGQFIAGALDTLKRCRPFIFMSPISREEAATACRAAREADYEFWAEAALPGADMSTMLLVGCPKEKLVKIDGFFKVELE